MPTLSEITTFQFVMAMIGIPLVLGFLTEAGKDLWNIIRKKPDASSYMTICAELRSNCKNKDDVQRLIKSDEVIVNRQNVLRDRDLPEMKESLTRIEEQMKFMILNIQEIKAVNVANAEALTTVVATNADAVRIAVALAQQKVG